MNFIRTMLDNLTWMLKSTAAAMDMILECKNPKTIVNVQQQKNQKKTQKTSDALFTKRVTLQSCLKHSGFFLKSTFMFIISLVIISLVSFVILWSNTSFILWLRMVAWRFSIYVEEEPMCREAGAGVECGVLSFCEQMSLERTPLI